MGLVRAHREKRKQAVARSRFNNEVVKSTVNLHNAMAAAENWENEQGPNEFYLDRDDTTVYKIKRGRVDNVDEAKKLVKGYPLKVGYPTNLSASFVDKYSRGNPHVDAQRHAEGFHKALVQSGAEAFA